MHQISINSNIFNHKANTPTTNPYIKYMFHGFHICMLYGFLLYILHLSIHEKDDMAQGIYACIYFSLLYRFGHIRLSLGLMSNKGLSDIAKNTIFNFLKKKKYFKLYGHKVKAYHMEYCRLLPNSI